MHFRLPARTRSPGASCKCIRLRRPQLHQRTRGAAVGAVGVAEGFGNLVVVVVGGAFGARHGFPYFDSPPGLNGKRESWCARQDSNLQPPASRAGASAGWATCAESPPSLKLRRTAFAFTSCVSNGLPTEAKGEGWCARGDSNPHCPRFEGGASCRLGYARGVRLWIRTRNREGLSLAALPVGVGGRSGLAMVPPAGFEPATFGF